MSVSAGMEERARLAKLREEVGPLESEAKPFNPLEPIKVCILVVATLAAASSRVIFGDNRRGAADAPSPPHLLLLIAHSLSSSPNACWITLIPL